MRRRAAPLFPERTTNMPNKNLMTVIGYLGRDPEERIFNDGGRIATFSVATSNDYRDKSGEWVQKPPTWHNVTVQAESLVDAVLSGLTKGDPVHVEGKARERTYTDSKTGEEKVFRDILAFYVAKPIYTKKENGGSGARRDTDDAYANRPPEKDIQFFDPF